MILCAMSKGNDIEVRLSIRASKPEWQRNLYITKQLDPNDYSQHKSRNGRRLLLLVRPNVGVCEKEMDREHLC